MAHQPLKNPDGTVNFKGVSSHLEFVKGKYAQNAKNYEANTGKKMNFGGADSEQTKGEMEEKINEPTTTDEAEEKP